MSTPITAATAEAHTEVWREDALCEVLTTKECDNGSYFLTWSEQYGDTTLYFGGSFHPDAYFGAQA